MIFKIFSSRVDYTPLLVCPYVATSMKPTSGQKRKEKERKTGREPPFTDEKRHAQPICI